ncbi:hypothetical protein [Enterococcus faecalis]|uniref:Uncharacterized protein n=1 Tax=Enterococcus faecalis TaxID=1351 RepID=A0AAW7K2Y2_ENTFL|nr:hypothetical protein [Enterococcus faecalis]EGO8493409.1 hypothetical protein [Enterococcus faecalis]MDN3072174.1 hypothetical protein [Enterococcus faecalis]MDN3093766.1 hypothetical protein [Enterococcus faecalis]MDN3191000.1 hypothetical protein [Enterococcus faecalis]HBC7247192.1 hypothetical protein [Enterococcus faecalis]
MKQTIMDALSKQKRVTFVFDKDFRFSATTLIDELPNDNNYIHVKLDDYIDSKIINLSTVKFVNII